MTRTSHRSIPGALAHHLLRPALKHLGGGALALFPIGLSLLLPAAAIAGGRTAESSGRSEIRVTPPALDFFVTAGQTPGDQSVRIRNRGSLDLDWRARTSEGWLRADPAGGTVAADSEGFVTVTIDSGALEAGHHEASIRFSDVADEGRFWTVRVTVLIEEQSAPATIAVAPSTLHFGTAEDMAEPPPAQTLQLWNGGGGTLTWNLSSSESWIAVDQQAGEIEAEIVELAVTVDPRGLEPGRYRGEIEISGNAWNSPHDVHVALEITPTGEPVLDLSPRYSRPYPRKTGDAPRRGVIDGV